MKRTFLIGTALLIGSAAAMAQYTNVLENGTEQTVTNAWSTDTVWVGPTTSSNTLDVIDGGMVTSTNVFVGTASNATYNTVSVTGTGSWDIEGTLEIGIGTSNVVSVGGGGSLSVGNLVLNSGNTFNLDSGGTFAVSTNFNVSTNGFNWNPGGELSVGGELTGMAVSNNAYFLDGGRDLTLDGGTWDISGTNLVVGLNSSGSDLIITNGGTVVNADGYIGWGTGSANNSVLVSGSGSSWTNAGGDLYVGVYWSDTNLVNAGSGNTLTVEDDAWVNVGDVQMNLAGGSLLVASTNGAQLVVGNGTVMIEDTLYLGLDADTTGTNIIRSGGTVSAGDLKIADGSLLDLRDGGTLAMTGDFNLAPQTNLVWNPGGELSVGGELTGMAVSNNAYFLDGGRDLTLDGGTWDISGTNLVVGYGGSGSDLVIKNTGTLSSATTYIGWDTNSANNAITVRDGSIWTNSVDLWVGYGADGNLLTISDAGTNVMAGNAYIGNTNTANNQVRVTGTNSLWNVGGNLVIGTGSNSVDHLLEVSDAAAVQVGGDLTLNTGNTLSLASGGSIEIDGDMNVYSNTSLAGSGTILFGTNDSALAFNGSGIGVSSNLVFDGGLGNNSVSVNDGSYTVSAATSSQYTNFKALALTDSTLAGYGAVDAFASIDMTGGMIDPQGESSDTAQLEFGGTFTATNGTVYRAQVYDTRWDELIFTGAGAVNLTNMEAEVLVVSAPTGTVTILSAVNLTNEFSQTTLVDRLLLYNAVLQVTNNEVQVSLEADPLESSMEFAATEMIRAGFGGMQNAVFTRTKQLRRNLVSTAHAIANETDLLSNTNAPAGAMGPGDQNTIFDMHVWLQQYSGQGDFDSQGPSDGYTLNNQGTSIGADRLVGEALTLGFNYTYARSSVETTGMDDLDSETYWIGAYGEWVGEEGLYVDALAAYGRSNYDSERREENYQGTASYRGQAFGAYADVGQYYHRGGLALSPYAGIRVLTILADGHDETDELGSSVYVDEVNRDLVESAIGLKMRHRFDTRIGRFQTTGYAEWAHDFIEDDVSATLTAAGFPTVGTGAISPDADTVIVGLGYSWISTDYLEVGIGYTGRFSENYEEHNGSLMLDIMF